MRLNLTVVLILIIITTSYSQTNPRLDEKGGFKDLKIDDPYSKWSKSTKLLLNNDSIKIYQLDLKTCCDYIFDKPVNTINITFKKDKLVKIEITTKRFQEGNDVSLNFGMAIFHNFRKQFITMFGDKYAIEMRPPAKILSSIAQWRGDKIILNLEYFLDETNFPNDYDYILVTISDLKYYMKDLGGEGF